MYVDIARSYMLHIYLHVKTCFYLGFIMEQHGYPNPAVQVWWRSSFPTWITNPLFPSQASHGKLASLKITKLGMSQSIKTFHLVAHICRNQKNIQQIQSTDLYAGHVLFCLLYDTMFQTTTYYRTSVHLPDFEEITNTNH